MGLRKYVPLEILSQITRATTQIGLIDVRTDKKSDIILYIPHRIGRAQDSSRTKT